MLNCISETYWDNRQRDVGLTWYTVQYIIQYNMLPHTYGQLLVLLHYLTAH